MDLPPLRIVTPRLVLRCWRPADAALLRSAIVQSLEHLRPWMPWAVHGPSSLEETQKRLEGFAADFAAGRDFTYGILSPGEDEVLGGTGLHPRQNAGVLEIGYWLRPDVTGRGYVTEASRHLVEAAFRDCGADSVEIRCDPANQRSSAVPRRLGFRHRETLQKDSVTPDGRPRDTEVWVVERPG